MQRNVWFRWPDVPFLSRFIPFQRQTQRSVDPEKEVQSSSKWRIAVTLLSMTIRSVGRLGWLVWMWSALSQITSIRYLSLVGEFNYNLFKDLKLTKELIFSTHHKMRACFSKSYENNQKICSQKSKKGLEELFSGYLDPVLDLVCGEYKDKEKCPKIIDKMPELRNRTNQYSFFHLLSKILDSIPEDK